MGHSVGIIEAPFNEYDIASVLGVNSGDVGTLCTSPKINKRSKYKPYPFGAKDTVLTNDILKQNNFCMQPAGISYNSSEAEYQAKPWKQWNAPVIGVNWLRMRDFGNYSHYATGGVYEARISTNNPDSDRRIMLGGKGRGRIVGSISFNFDTTTQVCPHEFSYPGQSNHSLSGFRFTLLFGPVEGVDDGFRRAPWVAQSERTIAEMISDASNTERLDITLDRGRTMEMTDSEYDYDMWLAILCLAPTIITDDDGKYVRVQDNVWMSSSFDFSDMRLVSLDMWDDGSIKTDSVLFSFLEDMDEYKTPANINIRAIGVSASSDYLTNPSSGYVPFTCSMNGFVYRDGSSRMLSLSSGIFSTIYFPQGSIIMDVAHYLEYRLFDSAGNLVFSGEKLVEEIHGASYNPTRAPYNLIFNNELEDYDVQLPTLPTGKYKLRLISSVRQTHDDIDYESEPPVRQVMGELSYEYEDDEYVPWIEDTGEVHTLHKDIEITIS